MILQSVHLPGKVKQESKSKLLLSLDLEQVLMVEGELKLMVELPSAVHCSS